MSIPLVCFRLGEKNAEGYAELFKAEVESMPGHTFFGKNLLRPKANRTDPFVAAA